MSKAFAPPIGTKFVTGDIAAIIHRRKEDADERFHHLLKRTNWEVVVPELVFEEVKGAERVSRRDQNDKQRG
jgi:ATP-dependent DNA helicase RecQ